MGWSCSILTMFAYILNHCHNRTNDHLQFRNLEVDYPDKLIISETIPFLLSIYPVSIQPYLQQGCCHSEHLAFTPLGGFLNLQNKGLQDGDGT